MPHLLETVKVVDIDGSYRIINKVDLSDVHVLWESKQDKGAASAPKTAAAAQPKTEKIRAQ